MITPSQQQAMFRQQQQGVGLQPPPLPPQQQRMMQQPQPPQLRRQQTQQQGRQGPISSIQSQGMIQQQQFIDQQQQQFIDQQQQDMGGGQVPQQSFMQGPRMSIQEAITRITIRLGKVETFINEALASGVLDISKTIMMNGGNLMSGGDNEIMQNIITRLTALESFMNTNDASNDEILELKEQQINILGELENITKTLQDIQINMAYIPEDELIGEPNMNTEDTEMNENIDNMENEEMDVSQTTPIS